MDVLYASLCKYYRNMSWEEFMDMDVQEIMNAVRVSAMPKEVVDQIWEVKHSPFEVFN